MDPDAPPSPKRPRLDYNQEKIQQQQQQQIIELLLKELQNCDQQPIVMINQHRQQNQVQQPMPASVPHLSGIHLHPQERQMSNMLNGPGNQASPSPSLDGNLCFRRFMKYLGHLRKRPVDNNIEFWKMFVSEYYSPDSKMSWCFSAYKDITEHPNVVFCEKAVATWCCGICGSSSGKGLVATFETFPRLLKTKFECGMMDEILFLGIPRACKIGSGVLMLKYMKAVQESVYENFRVVHEGKLSIVFGHDLKILSWEFCVQKHEEFLHRRSVARQVDELTSAAKRLRNSVGASPGNMRTIYDTYVSAEQQLAKNIDSSLLVNGLGLPKTFTRSLEIIEVVNGMKDLLEFSLKTKMGPIESLKHYAECCKIIHQKERQGNELIASSQNLPVFPYDSGGHASNSDFNPQFSNHSPYTNLERLQPSELGRHPHQSPIHKMLHEKVDDSRRKIIQNGESNSYDANQCS